MNAYTSRPIPARPFALPNLLTYGRIAAIPAVVACLYWQEIPQHGEWLRWLALAIFIAAAVTDILDGYFARKWGELTSFGRMLDPIADKLLVSSCLLMLAADGTIRGWSLWAAIVILCREILVSGLREYLAELRVSVPVTRLAKWKTTFQLVAVGFLLAGDAGDAIVPVVTPIGLSLLWTLYAGIVLAWGFLRSNPAVRYAALALFGLTVLKVFAVDLGAVKTGYRILSFLVLGIVLLLVSVAYQKRRRQNV
jgi:cardiolipin synthase